MLSSTRSVGEGHGDWQADKIHVANVGEDLGAVEGELAEAEVGVKVRIRGVCDGGFNESWARVKKEGQISVYGEPEAGTSETGNRHRPASTGSTERNGTVGLEGLLGGRRGVGVVGGVAIGLKEEDLVAVVNGRACDVGVDRAGGGLVLESNIESRVRHDEKLRCKSMKRE